MKSTLSLIIATTTLLAHAEERTWPTFTVWSYIADQYLGFQTGNPLSSDPVVQSGLNVSWQNGVFLDLAVSRSLHGTWDDGSFGNEVDYAAGWKGSLTDDLSLKVGVTYFDEPHALTLGGGDIVNPWIYLTRKYTGFSLHTGFENFTPLPNSRFDGGNLFHIGASTSRKLHRDRFELRASALLVYDTGTIGSGRGFMWRGNMGLDWSVTDHLTINVVNINWYAPMMRDKRDTDAMVMSGITYRF